MSTAARSRSSRSTRRTRARCHRASRPGGTLAAVRTVPTRKTRSASTSWPSRVADVMSSRGRSSTNSTSGPVLVAQHGAHLGHHRHQVALVGQPGRQEVGQGAEGDGARALGGRGPGHVAAGPVGEGQALVGQAGLADAGGAVDDEAVGAGVVQRGGEEIELFVAADEGPLQRKGAARVGRGAHPVHRRNGSPDENRGPATAPTVPLPVDGERHGGGPEAPGKASQHDTKESRQPAGLIQVTPSAQLLSATLGAESRHGCEMTRWAGQPAPKRRSAPEDGPAAYATADHRRRSPGIRKRRRRRRPSAGGAGAAAASPAPSRSSSPVARSTSVSVTVPA